MPSLTRMGFRVLVSACALVVSSAVGCASDSGGHPAGNSTGAATPDALRAMCQASCARSSRCNGSGSTDTGSGCVSGCTEKLGNFASGIRSDIAQHLTECYDTLECGMNDDRCTATAVAASGEGVDAALHAPDVKRCLDMQRQCEGTSGEFSDDTCGLLPLLVAGKRAALARCFDGDCATVAPCLQAEFGPAR